MNVTTEVAEKMRCPFSQKTCCSSGCMGWRWSDPAYEMIRTPISRQPEGEGWAPYIIRDGVQYWRKDRMASRKGYCGAVVGDVRVEVDSYTYSNSTEGVPITPESKREQQRNLKVFSNNRQQGWEEVRTIKA